MAECRSKPTANQLQGKAQVDCVGGEERESARKRREERRRQRVDAAVDKRSETFSSLFMSV